MNVATRLLGVLAGVLLSCATNAYAQCDPVQYAMPDVDQFARVAADWYYDELPRNATAAQKKVAADVAINSAQATWPGALTSAVADGLDQSPRYKAGISAAQEIAERRGEAARTDNQEGAASSTSGASNIVNKTGLASIISWAVEHGAVQRESNGTSSTFSTTPYALLLMAQPDSHDNFNNYWYLRSLGLAATVDLDESKSGSSGDFNADQVSAVTTSWRIGDRSPRTEAFVKRWQVDVEPELQKAAQATVMRNVKVLNADPRVLADAQRDFAVGAAEGRLRGVIRDTLIASKDLEGARVAVHARLMTELCDRVIKPIRSGSQDTSHLDSARIIDEASRSIVSLNAAEELQQKLWAEFQTRPVLTVKHTWNRSDEGSDYSEFVVAADGGFTEFPFTQTPLPLAPINLLLNVSVGLNHDPKNSEGQDSLRDYGISGSIEKSLPNPLRLGDEVNSVQQLALAVSGRVARQKDTDATIGVAQARLTIPLVRGFALVAALDYNTRTETDPDDEVRVSASVEFDGDKLAALNKIRELLSLGN